MEEDLDPRVKIELDVLNSASVHINQYENQLDDARRNYYKLLEDYSKKMQELRSKFSENSLKNARYYFTQCEIRKKALEESQQAAARYDRAHSKLTLARDALQAAEKQANNTGSLDSQLQELLNSATQELNAAKNECSECEKIHSLATAEFLRLEESLKKIERENKRDIQKCRPYLEITQRCNQLMRAEKERVELYEHQVISCKHLYQKTLRALEEISLDIHLNRRRNRGEGVGAETPPPPPTNEAEMSTTTIPTEVASCPTTPLKNSSFNVVDDCSMVNMTTNQTTTTTMSNSNNVRSVKQRRRQKLKANAMPLVGELQRALREMDSWQQRHNNRSLSTSACFFTTSSTSSRSSGSDSSSGTMATSSNASVAASASDCGAGGPLTETFNPADWQLAQTEKS